MNFFKSLFNKIIRESNDKVNKVDHTLHSSYEATSSNKENKKRNELEVWFLQTKRKKKKGPYTLKELTDACKVFTVEDGIRIRKGKSGQWIAWVNAVELYPMLPKPRFRLKHSSSNSIPAAKKTKLTQTETMNVHEKQIEDECRRLIKRHQIRLGLEKAETGRNLTGEEYFIELVSSVAAEVEQKYGISMDDLQPIMLNALGS